MSLDVELYVKVDTGGKELYHVQLFEANITHNLTKMATEAGIYDAVWHPENLKITTAGEVVPFLKVGIQKMEGNPKYYKQFDSNNGWGVYDDFLPWLKEYLEACERHPKATILTYT